MNQILGNNNAEDEEKSKEISSEPKSEQEEKGLLSGYVGKSLVEFMEKVEELGYTATYWNQGTDYTEILEFYTKEDCESFVIGSLEENQVAKTVDVKLQLKSSIEQNEKEESLKKKLELGSAWTAVKKYGEGLYGKTFKLHYIVGKIDESLDDENTWFLKAECTVNGQEKICEAKVTGTTANPEVVFFDIY